MPIRKHTDATLASDPQFTGGRILVLFTEEWCGPCQTLHRMLGEIESEIAIAEVEPSKNPGLKNAFDVKATPTLYLLDKGDVLNKMVGAPQSWAQLRQFAQL